MARLSVGFIIAIIGILFRAVRGWNHMTRVDVVWDLGIVVGSYAVVVVGSFAWNLIKAPAILDAEKTRVIEDAQQLVGAPGSLLRETQDMCGHIRDFICNFSAKNGPMPSPIISSDEEKKAQIERDLAAWCNRFAPAFRDRFGVPINQLLNRFAAEGQHDFMVANQLEQTPFYPKDALNVAALLFKMAMRFTISVRLSHPTLYATDPGQSSFHADMEKPCPAKPK